MFEKTERVEFQKWHSGFQCTRQILVYKSDFCLPKLFSRMKIVMNILKRDNYPVYLFSQLACLYTGQTTRFASMTCVFSLLQLDFCWFCHKYCILNLCCLIPVVLTGDAISLVEALTAVKALLKAL